METHPGAIVALTIAIYLQLEPRRLILELCIVALTIAIYLQLDPRRLILELCIVALTIAIYLQLDKEARSRAVQTASKATEVPDCASVPL
jgi:hypothetical protein